MAERCRILLVEVTPRVPQPIVVSTWSPTDKAAAVALSNANLTAAKSTIHATDWACVRGTVPMLAGQWYWTTTYGYTGTGDVEAGLAMANRSLLQSPGSFESVSRAVGINKAGQIRIANAVVGNLGTIPNGTVLRHWFDVDAGIYRVAVGAGGWVQVNPPTQGFFTRNPMYPIVGLLRPTSSTATITANFGASAFPYPVPDGVNAGVYSAPAAVPTTFYLGSEGFNTESGDVPASTHYDGRIDGRQDVEIEREGSCWVWGGQSVSRRGQIVFVNTDGGLDAWAGYDWRDASITLLSGYEGQTRAQFQVWSSGIVDTIEFTSDLRVRLSLADPLALLDRAIQQATYPDTTANSQAIGKPLPIVIGRPLYCTPVRLDVSPFTRNFQVHDDWTGSGQNRYLTSIDAVFDRGSRFSGPDDLYSANNPITLANGGNFTTWANDSTGIPMPSNWARVTGFGTTNDRFQQGIVAGTLRCLSSGQVAAAIYHAASTVLAGYRYTIAFDVTAVAKAGTMIFRADGPSANLPFDDAAITISTTGTKTVTLDVKESAQLQIVLGRSELDVTIDNLTVSSVQIIDWTYWSGTAAKMGVTLANEPAGKVVCNPVGQFNSNVGVVVERLNLVLAQLCSRVGQAAAGASVLSLMDKANYRIATYIDTAKTALQVIREAMDGWCGWIVPRRSGQLEVGRVEEPSATAVLTLDPSNVMGEITISTDAAKGLSIVIGGRRNHSPHTDADIATGVPLALAAELKTELTCIRAGAPALSSAPVSSAYTAAIGAPPKATLLQEPDDIQAEANRVATLWRSRRMFYSVTALLGASTADELEPGQTVRLAWPRYGLDAGKNLLVVGVRSRFFSRRVDLKLWG